MKGIIKLDEAKIVFDHIHIISEDPKSAAAWYEEMLDAKITKESVVRGGIQISVAFEGVNLLIRSKRPGEEPGRKNSLHYFKDYVSHDQWGTDHFGFIVHGKLDEFCDRLKAKGVKFSVEPYDFVPGVRISYIEAPDNVSIELVQAR